MNGGRRNFSGCGPSTAGIVAGGQGPGGTINSSETWNGTSWTETNEINSARRGVILFGNESHGISKNLSNYVDQWLSIKKIGEAESLNVAVATGIILNQLTND